MRFYVQNKRMKEWDLKDQFENKEEISNNKSTKSQVINNSSNPIGICKPRIFLGNCLGLQPNFSEI